MYDYLVGYARRDITPTQPAPLGGYGDTSNRLHTDVIDPLYSTAVAVTDGEGTTVLLLTTDLSHVLPQNREKLCAILKEKIGIPEINVFFTATHTHSAPDQGNGEIDYMEEFMEESVLKTAEAAIAAYEDRKKAQMFYASANTEGLNFVRHYLHEDGTYSGPGFGTSKTPRIAHSYEPDPEMRLIRFKREEGRDIILMNWQAHGTMNSYSHKELFYCCSADFVSGVRARIEEQEDCHFAYFQGAAGDLMPTSDIPGETKTKNIFEYGSLLCDVAKKALQQEKPAKGGPILVENFDFAGKVNHSDAHLLDKAEQVMAYFRETQNTPLSSKFARELGLISRHHAGSIVRRSKLGEVEILDCSVLAIGDIGFAAAPNELFSDAGAAIRKSSPYPMTFILGYCNNHSGYLPSRKAYEYFSYEVGCSCFAEGVAEEHAAFMAQKLTNLSKQ